ncbi:MAG: 50S ribosomal protein L10 [Candidatus Aenigmarchaeota archaeon]|nr:50S ribosomal protein L10 [Candidatus Aenigmarchaeota archaeon]
MVSAKKLQEVQQITQLVQDYPVVGVLNMHKLPGRQLHEIRNKLRGQVIIRMVKKRLLIRVFESLGMQALTAQVQGEPALFLTKENPFKIARVLQSSTSEAAAKPGDIAPRDLVIKAGPTNLPPGPAIGELQKVKIPAGVEGDKIVVRKDTVVARQGEAISREVADVLNKLGVKPMEIGLNLIAALEGGTIYQKDVLFVPAGYHVRQLQAAAREALSLGVYMHYFTKDTVPILLGRAEREMRALATAASIITPATAGAVLAKAAAEAKALEK